MVPVEPIEPGQCTVISVNLRSPCELGSFQTKWRLFTSNGSCFGGKWPKTIFFSVLFPVERKKNVFEAKRIKGLYFSTRVRLNLLIDLLQSSIAITYLAESIRARFCSCYSKALDCVRSAYVYFHQFLTLMKYEKKIATNITSSTVQLTQFFYHKINNETARHFLI